jgi:hypothetical protein
MATPTFTRVLRAVKEQSVRYDASETGDDRYTGNGNDRHLPIGRAANDDIYRALLKFGLDWSDVNQVVTGVLVVKSTDEVHVAFGAGPTYEVQRCTEDWGSGGGSEGSWPVLASGKAYPGPAVAGTTYTKGPLAGATETVRRLDITGILEAWAPDTVMKSDGVTAGDGEDNRGLRLKAPTESTTDDRYEIHGMRSAAARRPYIELTYIRNKPPLAPTITSPEAGGDPAYSSSSQADRLSVDFLFSDPDASNTCLLADLEVYGDGATDGAPGTRIAHRTVAPTALSGLNAYRVIIPDDYAESGQEMTARTAMRYRLRTQDSDYSWGPWSPLADGRFWLSYLASAPRQSYMEPSVDGPHIFGSLASYDPDDYITGWEGEFYADTRSGATALWTPGQIGIGGTSTRSDVTWQGASLTDGQRVRWRHRHANRDGQWGTWSGWLYTTVHAASGPDAMTPIDTSTKLLTRTPTLTIANSAAFTGYRWRLYRSDEEIHDSGETSCTSSTSEAVTPPAGLLAWGDGDDETPLEWEAQIKLASTGVYGEWSPRYAIRINALPGATVEIIPAPSASGVIETSDPNVWAPYDDVDKTAYNEWPVARALEIRETASAVWPVLPVAGGGALVERREDVARSPWTITQRLAIGRQLQGCTGTSGWAGTGGITVSTYGTPPTGYSGDSTAIVAAAIAATAQGYYALSPTLRLTPYGTGAKLRIWRRCTSSTNLTAWRLRLRSGSGNYWEWPLFAPGDTLSTWAELVLDIWDRVTDTGTFDPAAVDEIGIVLVPSGSYTGDLDIRDLRIGTVQDAKTSPGGDLASGQSYDLRMRYRDDATAKASTTLAAASIAGATNVKVASVSGLAAGDELTLGRTTGTAKLETRTISTVGTAGSGGTGVTVSEAFTFAHASADTADVFYWGGWSAWSTFTYRAPPVVAASTPADDASVLDPTQTLVWTFSSALAQDHAVIRIYRRTGTDDALIWEVEQDGTGLSYVIPPLLLEHGGTYAWEVEPFDTAGLSAITTRRHFHATFTTPTELAGLVATTDDSESWVRLAWTASGDSYLDHYRVYWRDSEDAWRRIDGGPERLGDGKTGEKRVTIRHYGGRLDELNEYKVTAHNGAQESEPAYVTATLSAARAGAWMLVESTGSDVFPLDMASAPRTRSVLVETYRPPGRGSAVHLAWGGAGRRLDLAGTYLRSEDGNLSAAVDRLIEGGALVWVKSPAGYGWDPFLGLVVDASDEPATGGMTMLRVSLEEVDWSLATGVYAWWLD